MINVFTVILNQFNFLVFLTIADPYTFGWKRITVSTNNNIDHFSSKSFLYFIFLYTVVDSNSVLFFMNKTPLNLTGFQTFSVNICDV